MLIAELIYPSATEQPQVTCGECEIGYPHNEHTTLFDSFKLAYFKVSSSELPIAQAIICHDCLFDFVLEGSSDPEEFLNFKILTKENEYDFSFEPEEIDGFVIEDENGGHAGLDHFLKVIITDEDS